VRDTLKPRSDSQIPIPSAEVQDDYAAASDLFDSLKIEEPFSGPPSAPTPTETLQDERHEPEEQFIAEEVKTAQKGIWPRFVFSATLPKSGNLWERFSLSELLI